MGLLILVVMVLAVLRYVLTAGNPANATALVSTVVVVLVPAGSLAAWLWVRRRHAQDVSGSSLARAADLLTEQVKAQWSNAAAEQRLMQPIPIPVRWRWSQRPVTGPLSDAVGDERGSYRFAPLHALPRVTATTVAQGGLRDLLGVYGGLDSGRLVILGAPGAGKTGAAIRLLLDAVVHREARSEAERSGVPVPMMFTLHGWDPISQPFAQWLADRLSRDYPFLKAQEFGPQAAASLISSGLVSVILDGLDEISEELRPMALRALDAQATFRVVLLTRSHEMVAAAAKGHLSGAAALELQPVNSTDAADYLARCQIHPSPPPWQLTVDHVRDHPESALAQALDTPLMLTLVRDTYQPGDTVDELLDTDRFGDREAVEDHLIDRVLPAAYAVRPGWPQSPYTLEQAQHWLGLIAHKMNRDTTRDLAWWLIPRWESAWPRIVIVGLMSGLVGGLLVGLVFGLMFGLESGLVGVIGGALGLGLLGLESGVGGRQPEQVGRLNWRRVFTRKSFRYGLVGGLVFGLLGGLKGGIEGGIVGGLVFGLLGGLVGGLLAGLGIGLVDGLTYPAANSISPVDPITCWRRDRRSGFVVGLLSGLVVGLLSAIGCGLVLGLEGGIGGGLVGGIVSGLVGGLTRSETCPTALAFVQLRFAGQGPFRLLRFLEDARRRHVLRAIGPLYQFRHGRLQRRLAGTFGKELSTPHVSRITSGR